MRIAATAKLLAFLTCLFIAVPAFSLAADSSANNNGNDQGNLVSEILLHRFVSLVQRIKAQRARISKPRLA